MNPIAERQQETVQATPTPTGVPRRDLWLLPLVSLCTVLLMLGVAEGCARIIWSRSQDSCEITGSDGSIIFKKNCRSRSKIPEGSWIQNATNECGYHNVESCGPKPVGTIRLVTLGSSFSYGYHVDFQQNYGALLRTKLNAECGKPIEVQNVGAPGRNIWEVARKIDEALALKPDAIIVSFTPFDFLKNVSPEEMEHLDDASYKPPLIEAPVHYGLLHRIFGPLKADSRSFMMLQHFMYEDFELHIKLFLLHDDEAAYIRTPFTPVWQNRFSNFDGVLKSMHSKSQAAGVPLLLLIGPDTNEIAAIRAQPRPSVDPYAFSRTLEAIAARQGVPVINPLNKIAFQPSPFADFYMIDGHMNVDGQKILEQAVNSALLARSIEPLAGCKAM